MHETLRRNTAIIQEYYENSESNFTSFNEISTIVDPTFQTTVCNEK